jgi:preprotein translocase subunit SecE
VSTGQIIAGVIVAVVLGALAVYREPVFATVLKTRSYMREIRGEMRKVTWPEWEELKPSTIVIVIFVIVIGIVIGVMDWIFSKILIDGLGGLFS